MGTCRRDVQNSKRSDAGMSSPRFSRAQNLRPSERTTMSLLATSLLVSHASLVFAATHRRSDETVSIGTWGTATTMKENKDLPPPSQENEPPMLQIVTSASADDSTDTEQDPRAVLADRVQKEGVNHSHKNKNRNNNRDALAYLLRYETCVRQQEAEDMAVWSHLRPCVERIEQLAYGTSGNNSGGAAAAAAAAAADKDDLSREISFVALKKALATLDEQSGKQEFMHTDRQLMMVLRLLTQKVDLSSTANSNNEEDVSITWAEFLQCYKVCIAGMQALQHLPADTMVRSRTRDRTLAMLSLFEPPSTRLFQEQSTALDATPLTAAKQRGTTAVMNHGGASSSQHDSSATKRASLFLLASVAVSAMIVGATTTAYWMTGSPGEAVPFVENAAAASFLQDDDRLPEPTRSFTNATAQDTTIEDSNTASVIVEQLPTTTGKYLSRVNQLLEENKATLLGPTYYYQAVPDL